MVTGTLRLSLQLWSEFPIYCAKTTGSPENLRHSAVKRKKINKEDDLSHNKQYEVNKRLGSLDYSRPAEKTRRLSLPKEETGPKKPQTSESPFQHVKGKKKLEGKHTCKMYT